MNARNLFEEELRQRNIPFSIDADSGRHALNIGGMHLLVSLHNLERDLAGDGDTGRVPRFVDSIASECGNAELSVDQLYWCLEPNDYEEKADFRSAVSDRVDRVLVHLDRTNRHITWVTPGMLEALGLTDAEAGTRAFDNLGRVLGESTVEFQDIDGVRLGYLGSFLPFKSALLLAPNLQEVAGSVLGWPLLAVAPSREFLYLLAARHTEFIPRIGGVVVQEYSTGSYPISTEVFEITEEAIRVIGEFPVGGRPITQ